MRVPSRCASRRLMPSLPARPEHAHPLDRNSGSCSRARLLADDHELDDGGAEDQEQQGGDHDGRSGAHGPHSPRGPKVTAVPGRADRAGLPGEARRRPEPRPCSRYAGRSASRPPGTSAAGARPDDGGRPLRLRHYARRVRHLPRAAYGRALNAQGLGPRRPFGRELSLTRMVRSRRSDAWCGADEEMTAPNETRPVAGERNGEDAASRPTTAPGTRASKRSQEVLTASCATSAGSRNAARKSTSFPVDASAMCTSRR